MKSKQLYLKDLKAALEEKGIFKSINTLRHYEKVGKITFPRDPLSNHRVFTPETLKEFVEKLMPKEDQKNEGKKS